MPLILQYCVIFLDLFCILFFIIHMCSVLLFKLRRLGWYRPYFPGRFFMDLRRAKRRRKDKKVSNRKDYTTL